MVVPAFLFEYLFANNNIEIIKNNFFLLDVSVCVSSFRKNTVGEQMRFCLAGVEVIISYFFKFFINIFEYYFTILLHLLDKNKDFFASVYVSSFRF